MGTIARLKTEVIADDSKFRASLKTDKQLLDDLGKTSLKPIGVGFHEAESSIAKFGSTLKSAGETLKGVGTSLSIGLTAPLLLLGSKIGEIGFSYEKAMNTFQAVTGATTQQMAAAAAMAEKLGADMTLPATSAADAALAMTELAKGGFTAQQAMDAARGALQLAAAAQIDEAKAAEITANAINTFGLSAADAVRVSDLLAAASNASSAEITDIAQSMQQAGSSAAALHIPIQDLVTAIGEMANAGIKGSDAGTSLKTFMAALIPHTKQAAAAMQELGIHAFDSAGNFIGLQNVIQQAAPALARMTTEQRQHAIQAAFGSDAMRAANIVLGQGVEKFTAMADAVGKSGAAAELAAAKTKGLSGAWDGLKSQLETVGLKLFQSVSGNLEGFVRTVASTIGGLTNLDAHVLKMGVTMAAVAASAGPIALLVGKLLTLGPTGAVTVAVIAGAAAMAAAYTSDFGAMQKTLDNFFSTFTSHTQNAKGDVGSFSKALAEIGIGASAAFDQLNVLFQKLNVGIAGLAGEMKAMATGNWNQVVDIWGAGTAALEAIDRGFQSREIDRQNQFNALQRGGVEELSRFLRDHASKTGSGIAEAITSGYKQADPFGKIQTFSAGEMKSVEGVLRSQGLAAGLTLGASLKEGTYSATHQSPFFIIHWLQEAADYAKNEAASDFGKAGTKMGDALKEGFRSSLGRINDFLNRSIGGTGTTIQDSMFELILRKFPEVANELDAQSKSFREANNSISLYGVMMQTAAGRNEEFTLRVSNALGAILQTDRVLRSQLTPAFANLGAAIQTATIITDDMGEAIRKSVGSLAELTINAKKAGDTAQHLADESFKALGDRATELASKLPSSWNTIIDAIVNGSGKVGSAVYEMAINIKGWAGDILGVIDTLPGHFGDAARKIVSTVDQWVNFADKVLAVLHRLDSGIPGSIGGIVEKIVGLFKHTQTAAAASLGGITSAIQGASDDWASELEKMSTGVESSVKTGMSKANNAATSGMNSMLGTIGKAASAAAGILGGIATFMGSRNQGKVTGVLGGAMSGMATGASIGMLFGPHGAAIGAGIGAAAGAIMGLFGSGKSAEQKRAEEEAKMKAGLDMQKLGADILSAQMEGLTKGLEFIKGLQSFSQVPTKLVNQFFNQIETILTKFADMAGRFKADAIEQSKALSEVMGSAFDTLLSGASLINAIRGVANITDKNIADFIGTTSTIFAKWADAAAQIELGAAKITGKISDKLKTSFEFLGVVPEVIKGFAESADLTGSKIDSVFAIAQKIVIGMKGLSEAERGVELNKAGANASIFTGIFDSIKSGVEAIKAVADIGTLDDSIWGKFQSFVMSMVTSLSDSLRLMDVASTLAANFKGLTDAVKANVLLGMDNIKAIASELSKILGGTVGGAGITANIRYQALPGVPITDVAGSYFKGAGTTSARTAAQPQSVVFQSTVNITTQADGSISRQTIEEIRRVVREENNKALDKLRLASAS